MGSSATRIQRAYAAGPYGQIHYRRAGPEGSRSPLVLLHPTPGTGALFENFMVEMGRDRTVIAPDLPGYGMSDAPPANARIVDYAGAMLELEASLGLGLFDIMGYHTGGTVAVDMARQQPRAVRKLVLIGAGIFSDQERKDLKMQLTERSPDERAAGMAGGWNWFKTDFWRMESDANRTWSIYVEGQKFAERSLAGQRAMADYGLADALPRITQPVLVLNPDDDMKEHTVRAGALLKNGRIHDLPGWTHGFLDAKTSEAAAIVCAFLAG